MGDISIASPAQADDHLLIVWAFPPPPTALDSIKRKFPSLKITFHLIRWDAKEVPNTRTAAPEGIDEYVPPNYASKKVYVDADFGIPSDLWMSATHLCTMANLPPPRLVKDGKCGKLRMIQFTSAGVNHVTSHPIYTDTEIPLATVSGIHGPPISEWITLHILQEGHRSRQMEAWQREKKWGSVLGTQGAELRDSVGKRCGILGYGAIGRQTARVLTSLGMTIVAYTASPRDTPESRRDTGYRVPGTAGDVDGTLPAAWFSGISKSDLHNFLRQDLDYLVIALPLTPSTTKLIGEEELGILAKSNCFLLNISRGAILDQPALIASLKLGLEAQGTWEWTEESKKGESNGIRGAALDVTDPEPLPEGHEMWELENCWITPHVSAVNPSYWPRAMGVLEENLGREMDGKGRGLVNLVDRVKGY